MPPNDHRNASNPDDQYLKSVKLDVPTFDGCHDPQFFLDWLQQLDRYTSNGISLLRLEKLSLLP